MSAVPEGTYITEEDVNNGKVLVQMDSSALKEELTQREIDFASAEASYTQAKEANDIQVNQNASSIAAAELRVKFTLIDLKKYLGEPVAEKLLKEINPAPNPNIDIPSMLEDPQLGGDALKNLKNYNNNITMAEGMFKQSSNQLDWTRKLRAKGYVSETELERDELNAQSNELQQQQVKIELEIYKLYTFPKGVAQALSDYEEAKRSLERTYAECRSMLAQKQADLKGAESRYESRKERLNKTKRNIELSTIRAPAAGLVIYGTGKSSDHYRRMRGSDIVAEGQSVYRGQTLISLPDMTKMTAEIDVHESSVDKVRPGQRAKIVMDAFPDKAFEGEVIKVAPLPNMDKGWFSPDLKVYTTQVSMDGTHDFLKPGMSAKVEILVEKLDDVIIAPIQAVANQEGKKVCYCLTSDEIERRVVQTGSFNDTFVQIIDGLEVGEEVLLSPPRLTETEPETTKSTEITEATEATEPTSESTATEQEKPAQQGREHESRGHELTDEAIERIMGHLAATNPEKAEELKKLKESDPEKFKAELRNVMREQFRRQRQDRGDTGRRGGDTRDRQNL
jgi:RND family efflux transporter MFP subunit